jgi:hypothetical protein
VLQDACGTCDADCSLACKALQEAGLAAQSTQVLVLHPKTLCEVFDSITAIGKAAGVSAKAEQLVLQLQQRLTAVAAAVQKVCPAAAAVTTRCTAAIPAVAVSGSPAAAGTGQPASANSNDSCSRWPSRSSGSPLLQHEEQDQQQQQQVQLAGGSGAARAAVPRVLSLEGLNPLALGGQWLPDVKLAAGCWDASGQQAGAQPERVTWSQVSLDRIAVCMNCCVHCCVLRLCTLPLRFHIVQLLGLAKQLHRTTLRLHMVCCCSVGSVVWPSTPLPDQSVSESSIHPSIYLFIYPSIKSVSPVSQYCPVSQSVLIHPSIH